MPYKDKEMKNEFIRKNTVTFCIRFSRNVDPEVIDWLDRQENPVAEIKRIIRERMAEMEHS